MAIAKYKAVKDYDQAGAKKTDDSIHVSIGHVFILDPKDAQGDVELGRLVLQKYLDPEDQNDQQDIDRYTDNPTGTKKPKVVVEEEAPKKETKRAPAKVAAPAPAPAKAAAKKTVSKK